MPVRSLILAAAMLSIAAPCHADMRRAEAAFRVGRYEAALDEADRLRTADAYAFRARTLLARAVCADYPPARSVLDEALAAAEAAIRLDPRHVEGRLQKAIALSLIARPMPLNEARRTGYAETARALAEGVLAEEDNAYAYGFMAVWHIEVIRRGGPIGAAVMGASLGEGRTHFEAGIALAPQDIGLRWQWARALAALDARKHADEIEAALDAALAIDPATELDRVMQARAGALRGLLKAGKVREVEAEARQML